MNAVSGELRPQPASWVAVYAQRIHKVRWLIIALWALGAALGVLGADKVQHEPDVLVYFDEARPERLAFDAVEARFGQSREVITLIAPTVGDVFTAEVLRAVARLAVASSARAEVTFVRTPLSDIALTPEAALGASDYALRAAAARLKAHVAQTSAQRSGPRGLVAADGSLLAVTAIVPTIGDNGEARAVARAHRALKSAVAEALPDANILQTGRVMIDDTVLRESKEGVEEYAGPQMFILATLLFVALGSLSLTVVVMSLVLIVLKGTVGALGWSGLVVNGISSAAPVVLMGLMVASAIHLVMSWQTALRAVRDQTAALTVALDRNQAHRVVGADDAVVVLVPQHR